MIIYIYVSIYYDYTSRIIRTNSIAFLESQQFSQSFFALLELELFFYSEFIRIYYIYNKTIHIFFVLFVGIQR